MPPNNTPNPFPQPNPTTPPPAQPYGQPPVAPAGPPAQPTPPPSSSFGSDSGPLQLPKKSKKGLLIIVGIVVLLVAVGVGAFVWMNGQKNGGNSQTEGDSANTKTVSWVEPSTVPAKFKKNDQTTAETQLVYYIDDATDCIVTTAAYPLKDDEGNAITVEQALTGSTNAAEKFGVKTTSNTPGAELSLKDVDGQQQYTFKSLDLVQDVDVETIDYSKQNNTVLYKQFGQLLSSIGYSCRSESWEANKAELSNLIKQFTLKTER